MDEQKLWLKLNKMHRDLKMLGYSTLGDDINENIKKAGEEIKIVLDKLKLKIEGSK